MSKNLVKSYFLARDEENSRVISTNELIEQKLERIRMVFDNPEAVVASSGEYEEGLFALPLEELVADEDGNEEGFDEEGLVSNVIKVKKEPVHETPVYTGPSPEELIEQAKAEIETMKNLASQEIESQRQQVLQDAQRTGFEEGFAQAQKQNEEVLAKLEAERRRLEDEYEQRVAQLEPVFVQTLTGIYEKIFEVELSSYKDLVVAMLRNTMKKIEGGKNFLVHVSKEDYPYVKEHREELFSDAIREGTMVDVIEDSTLRENECTIETDNGIFDCGLGTQMEGLRKRLILLSYEEK